LRNLEINRPNQVFAAGIMYIPMKRGFVHLFAIMDWALRREVAAKFDSSKERIQEQNYRDELALRKMKRCL